MKEIINIALDSATNNFDLEFNFKGHDFRIRRLGVDYDHQLALDLINEYDGKADIIALSGYPKQTKLGKSSDNYFHPMSKEALYCAKKTLTCDGGNLRGIYIPWSIRQLHQQHSQLFSGRDVGFYAGFFQSSALYEIEAMAKNCYFADPYFFTGVPKELNSADRVFKMIKRAAPIFNQLKLDRAETKQFDGQLVKRLLPNFSKADIHLIDLAMMDVVELGDLSGKVVVMDYSNQKVIDRLQKAGAKEVISCFPMLDELPFADYPILESILTLIEDSGALLNQDQMLELIKEFKLKPTISTAGQKSSSENRFSFVVHPLSDKDIFRHPVLGLFKKSSLFKKAALQGLKAAPGFKFGEISGIVSKANQKEVIGSIYTLGETPKIMMKSDTEHIYKKLVRISKQSEKEGAVLMGLGAYTKIVGDAGVTVNDRSPIPITTGNSLSAAATLWAANFAVKRMNLVKMNPEKKHYHGTAMIVGATGSIGKVSAKVLCHYWDRIILVAPRPYKLIEVADEIGELNPNCEVITTTNSNKYAGECDLIITTTSNQGEKVIDIETVRPGCVICDVSRPFDIKEEDALKRPDVLVIASGEVELPGDDVTLTCDIGLPKPVVYACLAETAVLMMEGRYESFSLSRNLSYQRVKEIDHLSRKHGVRLSAIMGHSHEITTEEIDLCREHAIERLDARGER